MPVLSSRRYLEMITAKHTDDEWRFELDCELHLGIADDVLRDLYVRGKYRDVILPMTVLRRLDAVLAPTKAAVIEMKTALDQAGITNQDAALRNAARRAFYNTSRFRLRDLRARASQQQLRADFEAYLDGFSPNVQEILVLERETEGLLEGVLGDRTP